MHVGIVGRIVVGLMLAGTAWAADDPLAAPGAADLLRAAAAQVEAGDVDAARATLSTVLKVDLSAEAAPAGDPEQAVALYREGDDALKAGDIALARKKFEDALAVAGDPRAQEFILSALQSVAVVGQPAGDLQGVRALQGKLPDLSTGSTLVFFFEPWCPHCQRELPELQKRLATLEARGIAVVGLTRLTRDGTDKDVKLLVRQGGVKYPLGVESGEIADRFAVEGIPAAAVVQDGVIVWRGHPQQLGDAALDRFATR